jgi:zinc transporter 1
MKSETKYGLSISMVGGFFLVELIVGIWAGSLSLQADAFHMLSDLLALVIGLVALLLARRERRVNYTYGWIRSEVIGGLINSVFLLAMCFNIIVEVAEKVINMATGELENTKLAEEIDLVLIVAGIGLAINLISLVLFHQDHDHGHKHEHGGGEEDDSVNVEDGEPSSTSELEEELVKTTLNLNQHAVWLHVMGDTLGSVVVIASGLMIKYLESPWRFIVDPIASMFIVVIITWSSIKLLRRTGMILLHRSPKSVEESRVLNEVRGIRAVEDVHEFHLWPLTDSIYVASIHVRLKLAWLDQTDVVVADINKVFHKYGIHSATIQPEFSGECLEHECVKGCGDRKCC